ncbi:MAG: energy-coupling factor transporter transmembrane component T [Methanospirillum sp.]
MSAQRPDPRRRRAIGARLAYTPGDSFVHRLDPRTRMATVLATALVCLAFETPLPLAGVLLLVAAFGGLAGLLVPAVRALATLLPLLATIVVIDAFFPRETYGTVFYSADLGLLHPVLSTGSIVFAVSMGLRLIAIALVGVLFVMTTPYTDLVRSLKSMGLPNSLTFALGYALRSTTWLAEDLGRIVEAQSARGLMLDRRSVLRHPSRLLALVIPMTVTILARSRHVTDAMQVRGYGAARQPTCYRRPRAGYRDALVGAALAGLLLAALLARFGLVRPFIPMS